MYTSRIIDIKEKERYNNFVKKHPKGHFLQLWEWGQVKLGMGWEPLPLILEEDGEIRAAMLILKRAFVSPPSSCSFVRCSWTQAGSSWRGSYPTE